MKGADNSGIAEVIMVASEGTPMVVSLFAAAGARSGDLLLIRWTLPSRRGGEPVL